MVWPRLPDNAATVCRSRRGPVTYDCRYGRDLWVNKETLYSPAQLDAIGCSYHRLIVLVVDWQYCQGSDDCDDFIVVDSGHVFNNSFSFNVSSNTL